MNRGTAVGAAVDAAPARPAARAALPRNNRLRLAVVSTYPPRRCGLASFAADLTGAFANAAPDIAVCVCAVDRDRLSHPAEVATTVAADDPSDYPRAARRLKTLGVDVVLIQHEYGIFGGAHGRHVLLMAEELRRLDIPYVVTLHTVPAHATPAQADILTALCRHAAAVTVFTPTAARLAVLHRVARQDQLVVVPHGAPDVLHEAVPRPLSAALVSALDAASGPLLSTFGLLSPAKGIETAIAALAEVVPRHPTVRYVVAGTTHPEHRALAGESYRERLHRQVDALGLTDHVRFVEDFMAVQDLTALLRRTDIYLTPYRSREQVSSGTLAFAVAAGCAAVSTDYHYARDLITPRMGALVAPDDPRDMARALNALLGEPQALASAQATSRRVGRRLSWSAVATTLARLLRGVPRRQSASAAFTNVVQ